MSKVIDMRDWVSQHNYMATYERMPCHISDGPQEPGDAEVPYLFRDEDEEYEKLRQEEIDDAREEHVNSLNNALREIGRLDRMLKP